ncbi:uncharacterized protein LOC110009734 [Jatropha curcas]|uniref:uncharacterized protein LOC110009734 n=1 Tax=Jatropha curcas TaxID=180498 RepID=UPI00189326B7|nr:uncharacterized protein LOC110009734 [Jatropha curcas]
MKLRPEFEVVRSNLLLRSPPPSLDDCLNELLREEQHHMTQNILEQQGNSNNVLNVAYATQGKPRNMKNLQCYSCKGFCHIASQSSKSFATVAKLKDIISKCRNRPKNCNPYAFHASTSKVVIELTSAIVSQQTAQSLTLENVQHIVLQLFLHSTLQEMVIRKTMAKEPKWGILFSLNLNELATLKNVSSIFVHCYLG